MVSASSATDPVSTTTTACSDSGDEQRHEADLDRADAVGAGLQRGVDGVRGVVAMGTEDRQQGAADAPSVPVAMAVAVPMAVPMAVACSAEEVASGFLVCGHLARVRTPGRICNRARAQ